MDLAASEIIRGLQGDVVYLSRICAQGGGGELFLLSWRRPEFYVRCSPLRSQQLDDEAQNR